jgi:hypothetical protein
VTIVILLVLVVVLWIAVLAPSALRRRSERQGTGSIDYFHHQLELLEHASPKIVNPAYRLHTAVPGGGAFETSASIAVDDGRPKLVLLRPTDDEASADVDDNDGCHYERVGVLHAPQPPVLCAEPRVELAAYRRQQARLRCTLVLRGLVGTVLISAVVGAVPGLRLAWIFTGLSGLATLGLIGLIGYAREMEAQRRHRTARVAGQWDEPEYRYEDVEYETQPASAGYPGGWDDEDEGYGYTQEAAAR